MEFPQLPGYLLVAQSEIADTDRHVRGMMDFMCSDFFLTYIWMHYQSRCLINEAAGREVEDNGTNFFKDVFKAIFNGQMERQIKSMINPPMADQPLSEDFSSNLNHYVMSLGSGRIEAMEIYGSADNIDSIEWLRRECLGELIERFEKGKPDPRMNLDLLRLGLKEISTNWQEFIKVFNLENPNLRKTNLSGSRPSPG